MRPLPSLLPLLIVTISLANHLLEPSRALPLSTSSRWIVDESGRRVKLACVNWASHLEPMLVEGMGKQPLDDVSKRITSMGFNCVRLTWPLFLVTDDSLASLTVRQSFQALGLSESIAAIEVNNPALLDLPLIQAFKAVVDNLAENDVMVILDNHTSKPGWCCSSFDGNGFFGDEFFDPDVWIEGLRKMAAIFNGSAGVVGMSLRNELRGPRQNVSDWYRYMQRGAEAVHSVNPNVLVILSGFTFDYDLSHLSLKQVELTFSNKLVFELHWYGFTDDEAWTTGNSNQVCGRIVADVMRRAGFLADQGWPLFLSEFGLDQGGTNENDNRYFSCMLGTMAELDLDWALWALQGSYYARDGALSFDETYGVLAWDWCRTRNSSLLQRIQAIQPPFQGPGLSDVPPYMIIFHPLTGLCVLRKSLFGPLELGPCSESEAWTYTARHNLAPEGSLLCLKVNGAAKSAELGILCSDSSSKWEMISDSKMHISSSKLAESDGSLCLDIGSDGKSLVTDLCECLSEDPTCDPGSQWFKMVSTTRSRKKSFLEKLASEIGRWMIP